MVVRFRKGAGAARRSAALLTKGAQAIGGTPRLQRVRVAVGEEVSAAQRLARDPAVAWAEPVYVRSALHDGSAEVTWANRTIGADPHPGAGYTGAGVRVAVVDSGVDSAHAELRGRISRDRFDAYGGNGRDDCGHGTAVAGAVAAVHNGQQVVGVAPDAVIVPVKVLRPSSYGGCGATDPTIAAGIYWAAGCARDGSSCGAAVRADVINLSLGAPGYSRTLAEAVERALGRGVVVVAASGNSGDRAENYPAALPNVISVGGVQRRSDGTPGWWPYSTFGKVDVAAPAAGVRVLVSQHAVRSDVGSDCGGDIRTVCSSGTSFAAPQVAGAAALLLEQHRDDTTAGTRVARMRQWLLGTARSLRDDAGREATLHAGHGVVQANVARQVSDPVVAATHRLLTWSARRRVISPSEALLAAPAAVAAVARLTDGLGRPVPGMRGTFSSAGRTFYGTTNDNGYVTKTFASGAAGRRVRLGLSFPAARVARPLEFYVLQHDDNIRGVRAPRAAFRQSLSVGYDSDDVYRFWLRAGETLHATLNDVSPYRYIDMWLFRPTARDVTTGYGVMPEDNDTFEYDPLRFRKKVGATGTYYLDAYGSGGYRMVWSIHQPNRVTGVTASPSTFSPNGDGYRDMTRVSWNLRSAGRLELRLRDARGRVRRTVDFGAEPRGARSFRWSGRGDDGRALAAGVYTATLHWRDGKGRFSQTLTKVTLRR